VCVCVCVCGVCVCGCTSGITIPAHYPACVCLFVCLFRKEEALPMKSIRHKNVIFVDNVL